MKMSLAKTERHLQTKVTMQSGTLRPFSLVYYVVIVTGKWQCLKQFLSRLSRLLLTVLSQSRQNTHTYVCVCVYIYICVYIYMYICVYMCVYMYIYLCMYNIYTYILLYWYHINHSVFKKSFLFSEKCMYIIMVIYDRYSDQGIPRVPQ